MNEEDTYNHRVHSYIQDQILKRLGLTEEDRCKDPVFFASFLAIHFFLYGAYSRDYLNSGKFDKIDLLSTLKKSVNGVIATCMARKDGTDKENIITALTSGLEVARDISSDFGFQCDNRCFDEQNGAVKKFFHLAEEKK